MPPDERGVHGSHGGSDGAPIVVDMSEPTVDIQAAIDPVVVDAAEPIVADEGESVMTPHAEVDEAHRRRLRRWAIGGGVLVAIVTGGVALSYTSLFAARAVDVQGETHLGPRRVLRIAGVGPGTNVVHLDESAVEARLIAEPWIAEATVTAEMPATIMIEIEERTPVLVVVAGSEGLRLVAEDGTVLGPATRSTGLPEFAVQPGATLVPESLRSAAEVTGAMAPLLRARVTSVSVSLDGDVSLLVDGDVSVRYGPVHEAAAKAQALRAILAFAEREGKELLAVDVTAPVAPTASFVGSYRPVVGPDPSADATMRGVDMTERSGSPSPSASSQGR